MKKRLNILYLIRYIRNEKNRVQYQRAKYLSEKNNLYLFICKNRTIPNEIKKNSYVKVSTFNLNKKNYILYLFWYMFEIKKLSKEVDFDIVYTKFDPFSIIQGFILKLLGYRWVVDIWDHPILMEKTDSTKFSFIHKFFHFISKKTIKFTDLAIVAIVPESLRDYGLNQRKILKITNGVDLNLTKPRNIKNKTGDFTLFYVGFVKKDRGIDTLLHSVKLLKEKIPSIKLILVGDTNKDDKNYLNNTINKFNIDKNVEYLGVLDHRKVLDQEEKSDICIFPFPYKEELNCIYPIKIFEYLSMGKVVISSDLEGVRTIIDNEENGLLVPPENSNDMANAIFRIYNDDKLRKRIEKNARNSVKKYNWDKLNDKIDEKLKNLFS